MKTPQEKYNNDPVYRRLVDTLENYIHQANYTPSELREATLYACINYEMHRLTPHSIIINKDVEDSLELVHKFLNTNPKE